MPRLVNLTPHEIVARNPNDGTVVTVPPSGQLARCTQTQDFIEEVPVWLDGDGTDGGPMFHKRMLPARHVVLTRQSFGAVEGLPPCDPNDDVRRAVELARRALGEGE